MIVAGSRIVPGKKEDKSNKGIVSGHEYAVLDYREVEPPTGKERLVKLRNPWGDFEWKGDWGHDSDKWNLPGMKSELKYKGKEDGTFWMPFSDFLTEFSQVQASYFGIFSLQPEFHNALVTLKPSMPSKYLGFKIKVYKTGAYFFSINQRDFRHFRGVEPYNYRYVISTIVDANTGRRMICQAGEDRNCHLFREFLPGEYLWMLWINWNGNKTVPFTLTMNSPKDIDYEYYDLTAQDFAERMIPILVKKGQKTQAKRFIRTTFDAEGKIFCKSGRACGFHIFYLENQTDTDFTTTLSLSRYEDVQPFNFPISDANNPRINVTVRANNCEIIAFRILNVTYGCEGTFNNAMKV